MLPASPARTPGARWRVLGTGASAIATACFYVLLGVDPGNITMGDSSGIITEERAEADEVNEYKRKFALNVPEDSPADAMEGIRRFRRTLDRRDRLTRDGPIDGR